MVMATRTWFGRIPPPADGLSGFLSTESTPPASVCQLFRLPGTSREWETFSATANRTSFGRIQSPASTASGSSTTAFLNKLLRFQPSQAWHIAGVADFNGDGQADLVWENTLS